MGNLVTLMGTSPIRLRGVALLALTAFPLASPGAVFARPEAPPAAPPALRRQLPDSTRNARPAATATALPASYSIGDPSDEEQMYLEYINRARADPAAEGIRFANDTDPVQ